MLILDANKILFSPFEVSLLFSYLYAKAQKTEKRECKLCVCKIQKEKLKYTFKALSYCWFVSLYFCEKKTLESRIL